MFNILRNNIRLIIIISICFIGILYYLPVRSQNIDRNELILKDYYPGETVNLSEFPTVQVQFNLFRNGRSFTGLVKKEDFKIYEDSILIPEDITLTEASLVSPITLTVIVEVQDPKFSLPDIPDDQTKRAVLSILDRTKKGDSVYLCFTLQNVDCVSKKSPFDSEDLWMDIRQPMSQNPNITHISLLTVLEKQSIIITDHPAVVVIIRDDKVNSTPDIMQLIPEKFLHRLNALKGILIFIDQSNGEQEIQIRNYLNINNSFYYPFFGKVKERPHAPNISANWEFMDDFTCIYWDGCTEHAINSVRNTVHTLKFDSQLLPDKERHALEIFYEMEGVYVTDSADFDFTRNQNEMRLKNGVKIFNMILVCLAPLIVIFIAVFLSKNKAI